MKFDGGDSSKGLGVSYIKTTFKFDYIYKMGPPPPPGEEKIVIMKAVGGEIGSASALAPKLGPLGLVSKNTYIDGSY